MPPVPWVLDLDGVVWLADTPIPGAAAAVERLRATGDRVVFVTNNSNGTVATVEAKLEAHGIPAAGDVVTSATVAATLVEPGTRVLVCGGDGVREAVRSGARQSSATGTPTSSSSASTASSTTSACASPPLRPATAPA